MSFFTITIHGIHDNCSVLIYISCSLIKNMNNYLNNSLKLLSLIGDTNLLVVCNIIQYQFEKETKIKISITISQYI